eukprot:5830933-Heterocapsa_arctica.AAC.1
MTSVLRRPLCSGTTLDHLGVGSPSRPLAAVADDVPQRPSGHPMPDEDRLGHRSQLHLVGPAQLTATLGLERELEMLSKRLT